MENDSQKGMLAGGFENFNAEPSAGLWDAISAGLDEKKKRRAIIWWWIGPGIAAVALIAIFIYSDTSATQISAKTEQINTTEINQKRTDVEDVEIEGSIKQDLSGNLQTTAAVNSNSLTNDLHLSQGQTNTTPNIKTKTDLDQVLKGEGKEGLLTPTTGLINEDLVQRTTVKRWAIAAPKLIAFNVQAELPHQVEFDKKRQQHWEIGFGLSSWNGMDNSLLKKEVLLEADTAAEVLLDFGLNSALVKTSRPIGLNFHFAYNLANRLRIVSGLNVERTAYRIHDINDFSAFQYVGQSYSAYTVYNLSIPLGIQYDLFDRKRLRFGLGLNVLNEFPIIEYLKPNYEANFVGAESTESNFIRGYNLGLNPAFHVTYYLNEKLKIQGSPGMRWYPIQRANQSINVQQNKIWFGGALRIIWEI